MSAAIVWFRRDLRLEDNPALAAALRAQRRIVCAYIHAPDEEAPWTPGAASRCWLHHSLAALDAALQRCGTQLHLRRGPTQAALDGLLRDAQADAVYFNRLYEPALAARDAKVESALRARGIDTHSFNANLLVEPREITTGQGGPYRVFTPFWRNVQARLQPQPPLPAPKRIAAAPVGDGVPLDALGLRPRIAWDAGFHEHWRPGETGAQELLRRFCVRAAADYARGRDRPDRHGTSRLSPHLHFGEVGPRQVLWQLAQLAAGGHPDARAGIDAFARELGWREFSHHVLCHFRDSAEQNVNRSFDAFAWQDDAAARASWQQGRTGIPIVDAGMRELWRSGWMHNRVRMLVASFLTKNLRQHWLQGARWFWDTLLDADLANNTLGWQWIAGTGFDAAPFFRIFNPVAQGKRFDPDGDYVRRWVPELAHTPAALIHQPWLEPGLLQKTGYPAPIADVAASRDAALQAYNLLRRSGG